MNPERARIRSYLQAQAASLSVPEIVARVQEAMAELRGAAQAPSPPAAGQWSPAEVLAHVVASGADVARAIAGVLEHGASPARHDSGEDGGPAPIEASLSSLHADRDRLFARALAARGDEHLAVTWPHPFFGDLNWREWLLFLRIHDLDHARQLRA